MTKVSTYQWEQARALFETGESLRTIADKTKIDFSNISKRAKKEDWQRDVIPRLATANALNLLERKHIDEKITTLLPQQQRLVEHQTRKILIESEYFETAGKEVADIAMQSLRAEPTVRNAKEAAETLKTTMQITGVVPFYPNAVSIHQVNQPRQGENDVTLRFLKSQ